MKFRRLWIARLAVIGIAWSLFGCGSAPPSTTASTPAPAATPAEAPAAADHSGWWCNEHGVPEEECARCDASLVAEFKERNDWCAEHELPESQCLICQGTTEGS